uniref:Uncharacterized protein n=1 Tax=Avena sativa TaxID=4498 RepID=A0ACD5VP32_AVESA
MSGGNDRHGKGPAEEPGEEKFPVGLRVLAIDDDPACLGVLDALLRVCKYKPMSVTNARTTLEMLREGGEEQFDLVITNLHMPDMDGFQLLEIIGLEMDLPVIMLSVNGEKETVYEGIVHGACDYLVKPVNIKELKNIWRHVVRKNHIAMNHNSSDSDDADERMMKSVMARKGGAKDSKKRSKKKKNGGHSRENRGSTRVPTTQKMPRVSWTGELNNRFLEAVNRLGADKAAPKAILRMMNVKNLSRECVASHLQKYRLALKRVAEEPEKYILEVQARSNKPSSAPSILGPHGLSIQPRNRSMGNGGSMARNAMVWQPDASRRRTSAPPVVGSSEDRQMLDAFHPNRSTKAYVGVLREKLLEASMVPSSHPRNSSVEEMPPDGEHVNQAPTVQPPRPISQLSPWQNAGPSSIPGPTDGAPLFIPSQVSMLQISQLLPSFGASPGPMVVLHNEQQNQMAGIFSSNNATPVAGFSAQMTPLFSVASNTGPAEMTQMMVNGGTTSSAFPSLGLTGSSVGPLIQMALDDSVASAGQVPNGGDTSGILPLQDGPADQQDSDDQPTHISNLFLQQILASMANQDFNPDDAFFGEEY